MIEVKAREELLKRCNGLNNPNHVLGVAMQMQKVIYDYFEQRIVELGNHKTCEGCKHYATRHNIHGDTSYEFCTKGVNEASDSFYCSYYEPKDTE